MNKAERGCVSDRILAAIVIVVGNESLATPAATGHALGPLALARAPAGVEYRRVQYTIDRYASTPRPPHPGRAQDLSDAPTHRPVAQAAHLQAATSWVYTRTHTLRLASGFTITSHSAAASGDGSSIGAAYFAIAAQASGRTSCCAGRAWIVSPTMRLESSSFSIGLTLRWTTVLISVSSKQCVAAMTTCRLAQSIGSAPLSESASSRSKHFCFSRRWSASPSVSSLGFPRSARCDRFVHVAPTLIFVGRIAPSVSSFRSRLSSSLGIRV